MIAKTSCRGDIVVTRRQILGVSILGAAGGLIGPRLALAETSPFFTDPQPHIPGPTNATPESVQAEAADIRDLLARPWQYENTPVLLTGFIISMRVAPPEMGFPVGDNGDQGLFRTQILLEIRFEEGPGERAVIAADFDPEDIHKSDVVDVVGIYAGDHLEPGGWSWPCFVASSVTLSPEEPE